MDRLEMPQGINQPIRKGQGHYSPNQTHRIETFLDDLILAVGMVENQEFCQTTKMQRQESQFIAIQDQIDDLPQQLKKDDEQSKGFLELTFLIRS